MIVADTNLVVYSVIEGERSAAARRVRQRDAEWAAPPLWRSEFRNVLTIYVRQGLLSAQESEQAWRLGASFITHPQPEPDPVATLRLAHDRRLSGYDAEFAALAEALGVPLVTADRRLLQACPDLAVSLEGFVSGS